MAKKSPETETKKPAEQTAQPATAAADPSPAAVDHEPVSAESRCEQLRAKLRVPFNQVLQILGAEIETHAEREGLAVALDQLVGRLNMMIERISRR